MQPWMDLKMLISGYDINCQYIRKLGKRLEVQFPQQMLSELQSIDSSSLPADIRPAIGKYHAPMHTAECRPFYSLHNLPGAGDTFGENAEQKWADIEGITRATKEMSPGHRHDVINDFYNGQNFRKTNAMCEYLPNHQLQHTYRIMLGKTLIDKAARADTYGKEMEEYLATLEVSVVQEKGEGELKKWKVEEAKFKADVVHTSRHDTLDNPYDPKTSKRAFEVLFV